MARKVVGVGSVGTRPLIVLLHDRDAEDRLFLQVNPSSTTLREVTADHVPGPMLPRFRQWSIDDEGASTAMSESPTASGEPVLAWLEHRTSLARRRDVEFDDPKLEYRRLFSEVWGTFLLVLVAAGGGVVGATAFGGDLTLAMKALAPGMMVMGIIFFMGTISGAHLNPAVTLAFAVRGNFPWRRVPGYILAQVIGAVLASWFLQLVYGGIINGATEPTPDVRLWVAMLTEAVLTLGLVSVILGTASGARNVGINGALAVGAYIGLVSVWGAPVSGASMNPARSLGPELIAGDLTNYWIYLVGPIIGALIAVGFEYILKGKPTKAGAEAAQGILDENPQGI
jgi:aquaporin Z